MFLSFSCTFTRIIHIRNEITHHLTSFDHRHIRIQHSRRFLLPSSLHQPSNTLFWFCLLCFVLHLFPSFFQFLIQIQYSHCQTLPQYNIYTNIYTYIDYGIYREHKRFYIVLLTVGVFFFFISLFVRSLQVSTFKRYECCWCVRVCLYDVLFLWPIIWLFEPEPIVILKRIAKSNTM